jgi:hypothetical protein
MLQPLVWARPAVLLAFSQHGMYEVDGLLQWRLPLVWRPWRLPVGPVVRTEGPALPGMARAASGLSSFQSVGAATSEQQLALS